MFCMRKINVSFTSPILMFDRIKTKQKQTDNNIIFWGGGVGVYIFLRVAPFELLIHVIRNKISSLEGFEFTRFWSRYMYIDTFIYSQWLYLLGTIKVGFSWKIQCIMRFCVSNNSTIKAFWCFSICLRYGVLLWRFIHKGQYIKKIKHIFHISTSPLKKRLYMTEQSVPQCF